MCPSLLNYEMGYKYMNEMRKCFDCGESIFFGEFCNDNPSMPKERAEDLWGDSLLSICCIQCFFRRPEKPFKKNMSFYRFHSRFRK